MPKYEGFKSKREVARKVASEQFAANTQIAHQTLVRELSSKPNDVKSLGARYWQAGDERKARQIWKAAEMIKQALEMLQ